MQFPLLKMIWTCLSFQQRLMILSVCYRKQIKTSRISSLHVYISLSWLTLISATAYLDMVNVFSSHYFCSHRLFKVIKACCIDQRTRLSISWCLKSFFARCRMQFDAERQGDSLDRFSLAIFDKWSFLRLQFLQIPLFTVCWFTEVRSFASKTKASSNRSQQRTGTPVNRLQRISHLSKVAVSR